MSEKVIAHIPARGGSERVPRKNLREFAGAPLICRAIEAAHNSALLTDFYVNTDSDEIAMVAEANGAKVHRRPEELARSEVTQDRFNFEFIRTKRPDILVLINPVCPLITAEDVDGAIRMFRTGGYDSVIGASSIRLHAFVEDRPVNFDPEAGYIPMTQNLPGVRVCNFAVNVWDARAFARHFETKGHACFVGKVGFYELPLVKGIKISDEGDFRLAQAAFDARLNACE